MALIAAKVAPPSDDKRWRLVDATMRRNGYRPHGLIETLHTIQEAFGYLDQDALQYVAATLHTPPSRVFSVATFYSLFNLKPQGAHTCVVCAGTACYIKGAKRLLEAVERQLGLQAGQTTEDGQISLVVAHCIGSCGLAPAAVFDGEVAGTVTPDQLLARLAKWNEHDH